MTAGRHKVVMYTTPTCSYCRLAKTYLNQNRVRYTEIDVSRDQRAAADMVRRSGQSAVPVILIDNRPIVGFDRRRIERMLGL
jgi:glutaredoxin-like YruB-family protein